MSKRYQCDYCGRWFGLKRMVFITAAKEKGNDNISLCDLDYEDLLTVRIKAHPFKTIDHLKRVRRKCNS